MADFHALCVDLVRVADALDGKTPLTSNQGQALDGYSALIEFRHVADRAQAALAEPEPEVPTDEELMKLLPEDLHKEFANWSRIYAEQAGIKPGLFRVVLNTHTVDFARAVLARWGNHPGSPNSSTQPF